MNFLKLLLSNFKFLPKKGVPIHAAILGTTHTIFSSSLHYLNWKTEPHVICFLLLLIYWKLFIFLSVICMFVSPILFSFPLFLLMCPLSYWFVGIMTCQNIKFLTWHKYSLLCISIFRWYNGVLYLGSSICNLFSYQSFQVLSNQTNPSFPLWFLSLMPFPTAILTKILTIHF